jgi:GAF domain-containing protein
MSATPDSTFTDPEQRIADLERQLAERESELAEARERETATAEVLGIINSSPSDLTPVFEAILDKALRLCGGTFGIIRTYDGEAFHLGAMRGVPHEIAELIRQPRRPPFTGMAIERILAGEPVVEIANLAEQPVYRAGAATVRALADIGGARSGLWVALRKDEALLGLIWVYRREVQPFNAKQIALLQNFAAQAVIAMENARLIVETREALDQQTATAEVLQVINSSPGELEPVFQAMLQKATRLCDFSMGLLWTHNAGIFHPVAWYGAPPAYADFLAHVTGFGPFTDPATRETALGQIAAGKDLVQIDDAAALVGYDERYVAGRALVELAGARTVLCVAMRRDDALLGAITVYRQEVRPCTDKQIALFVASPAPDG